MGKNHLTREEATGIRLREARKAMGLTQMDVIFELRYRRDDLPDVGLNSQATLSRYEAGEYRVPIDVLLVLAALYKVTVSDLDPAAENEFNQRRLLYMKSKSGSYCDVVDLTAPADSDFTRLLRIS